jgi:hypothetical protein
MTLEMFDWLRLGLIMRLKATATAHCPGRPIPNADNIGGCGFCGYKGGKNEGHRRKSDWLKKRYSEGLSFKVLRSREFGDVGMIEYAVGHHAWRPVEAEGYLVIHCLMVNGKHKGRGLGAILLDSCLRDAKKCKCRGVAVVTSSDSVCRLVAPLICASPASVIRASLSPRSARLGNSFR